RRPHPQGCEACGFACSAIEQVRARHQRANGTHARSRRAYPPPTDRRRGDRVRRRAFIALLGGAAAWPLVARAQQAVMPVVGFVYPGVPELSTGIVAAFRKGLNEAGFIEGRNVTVEFRFA